LNWLRKLKYVMKNLITIFQKCKLFIRINFAPIFLFLIPLFFISSCSKKDSKTLYPYIFRDKFNNLRYLQSLPKHNNVSSTNAYVFLDATLSMQGFTTPSKFTIFCNSLRELKNTLLSSIPSITYFKFGEIVKNIDEENFKFFEPSFYMDYEIFKRTFIENVIDSALIFLSQNPQNLIIIITDLYQDKSTIDKIVTRFSKLNEIIPNISISIIQIKSEYNGTVYDVSESAYKFPYHETQDTLKFRPFYIICIAPYDLINKFTSEFTRRISSQYIPLNQLIISNDFISSSYNFTPNVSPVDRIADSIFTFNFPDSFITLKKTIIFNDKVITPLTIIPIAQFYVYENNSLTQTSPFFSIDCKLNQNELLLTLKPTYKLDENKKYITYIALVADQFSIPDWVEDSDLKINEALLSEWIRKPSTFPGSKTYNLYNFISLLSKKFLNNICIQDILIKFEK
jgi:hypothetical protein